MRRWIALFAVCLPLLASEAALAGGYVPNLLDKLTAISDKTGIIGGFPGTQISSGSTSTSFRHHLHISTLTGTYNPQLVYSCSYVMNAGEDSACPNAMTIKAVLGYNGVNYPVSIGGTTGSYSLGIGATVISDPIGVTIPAGSDVYICTYVTVASGGWPLGRALASATGGEGSSGTNGADDTGACAAGTGMTSGGYSFGPMAIVGHPLLRGQKAIGLVGDSICAGSGDAYNTATGVAGYLERALGNSTGDCQEFRVWAGPVEHCQAAARLNRSAKRTAN